MSSDLSIGLQRGIVRVVPADPTWPDLFRAEVDRLAAGIAVAGLPALTFEHIGSTAVPGLAAKPIIDLMAGYGPDANTRLYLDALRDAGYEYRGPQDVPFRELFVLGSESRRTHHLNLTPLDSPFWRDHLAFRDRLRNEPAVRADYSALKHRLAEAHPADRHAYTEGKAAFIEHVTRSEPPPPAS
jgi:GrpB-like predicted nucleotidyltransferase (UPF0157 family)